jgi:hypothetical protein
VWYGPLSYHRLGRVHPRRRLREPYHRAPEPWLARASFIPDPGAETTPECPRQPRPPELVFTRVGRLDEGGGYGGRVGDEDSYPPRMPECR